MIVKMLVNAGADIEKGDGEDGWTPLMCAASACSIQLVDYLIKEREGNVLFSEFITVSALIDHKLGIELVLT